MTTDATSHSRPAQVRLGNVSVSRLILGGNPFSGFSHQTVERDHEMLDWFTMERIKALYREAERVGVTTHIGRADNFIMRALREHWNERGGLTWIAQQCPEIGSLMQGVRNAVHGGAACCFLHGGEMDMRVASGDTAPVIDAIRAIHDAGMPAGVAGHRVETLRWAAEHLELEFFMTCYYNPSDRTRQAQRDYDDAEYYGPEDRDAMADVIRQLPAPAIHYKVLAAGRNEPKTAFDYVADLCRPGDAVCVGVFNKDHPAMLQEDIDLLEAALQRRGK